MHYCRKVGLKKFGHWGHNFEVTELLTTSINRHTTICNNISLRHPTRTRSTIWWMVEPRNSVCLLMWHKGALYSFISLYLTSKYLTGRTLATLQKHCHSDFEHCQRHRTHRLEQLFFRKDGKSFAEFLLEEKRVLNTTAPKPTTRTTTTCLNNFTRRFRQLRMFARSDHCLIGQRLASQDHD